MLGAFFARRGLPIVSLPDGGSIVPRFTSAIEEHRVTRRGVGLFDFSFMGWWEIAGSGARAYLERLQTRDVQSLATGRLVYTLLLRDDASVFVDATLWRVERNRYWLFTGRRTDVGCIAACASTFDVRIAARHDEHCVIAVQGPASATLLDRALPHCDASSIPFFAFRRHSIDSLDAWVARLGYTGEIGFEILAPAEIAVELWIRLAQASLDVDRLECGMDAANSLRIEAGFIHFAHELRDRVLPGELGLSRLVRSQRMDFIGARALRDAGEPKRRLTGVAISPAGVHDTPDVPVHLTSKVWSPTFDREIGLGFVEANLARGTAVVIDDNRAGTLVELPFYTRPG
ncbi:MAG TPA: aminomethyltransferase family protein, partial [Casimicrobiaceae bacterium]|nr:aminomethyltransferase family protein [Casimicrobiaceae bacterium]